MGWNWWPPQTEASGGSGGLEYLKMLKHPQSIHKLSPEHPRAFRRTDKHKPELCLDTDLQSKVLLHLKDLLQFETPVWVYFSSFLKKEITFWSWNWLLKVKIWRTDTKKSRMKTTRSKTAAKSHKTRAKSSQRLAKSSTMVAIYFLYFTRKNSLRLKILFTREFWPHWLQHTHKFKL